mmetsp:Transcript_1442/g.8860  ORF Transcript_1442/g.8860 Transcript_1442/m.8860 type:complete len:220 (+) Transcript_1442:104-763(+)
MSKAYSLERRCVRRAEELWHEPIQFSSPQSMEERWEVALSDLCSLERLEPTERQPSKVITPPAELECWSDQSEGRESMDSAGIDQSDLELQELVVRTRGDRTSTLPRTDKPQRPRKYREKQHKHKQQGCKGRERDPSVERKIIEEWKTRQHRKRQLRNRQVARQAHERAKSRLDELEKANQALAEMNKILIHVVKKLQKKVFAGRPVPLDERHLLQTSE